MSLEVYLLGEGPAAPFLAADVWLLLGVRTDVVEEPSQIGHLDPALHSRVFVLHVALKELEGFLNLGLDEVEYELVATRDKVGEAKEPHVEVVSMDDPDLLAAVQVEVV